MSMVQLQLGMKRGWKLGSFQGSQATMRKLCWLSPVRLYNFETFLNKKPPTTNNYVYKPIACMLKKVWVTRWLQAYFKQIWSWVLHYSAELPDETHESGTRIWVNTAPLLWAPHMAIFTQILLCFVHNIMWIIMLRDSAFRNCSIFKSQCFHSVEDSGEIQNLNQFTFNKAMGTFGTQESVRMYDFPNIGISTLWTLLFLPPNLPDDVQFCKGGVGWHFIVHERI